MYTSRAQRAARFDREEADAEEELAILTSPGWKERKRDPRTRVEKDEKETR